VSQSEHDRSINSVTLLPHQSQFVETVFSNSSKRIVLLRAPVGMGKSAALAGVARHLLRNRPTARSLALVRRALQSQFTDWLKRLEVPAFVVDRYVFRELLDVPSKGTVWPTGVVSILSIDFAKQEDVRDSLAQSQWDMLFVDECHFAESSRTEAIRRIGQSAERIILSTATPDAAQLSRLFPSGDITVIVWQRDQIVDLNGKPLFADSPRVLHEVSFSLNEEEINLRKTVTELSQLFRGGSDVISWRPAGLASATDSSPAALEAALRGFLTRMAPIDIPDEEMDFLEDLAERTPTGQLGVGASEEDVSAIARLALQRLEEVRVDSKLSAFSALLAGITQRRDPARKTVILTEFSPTLFYLVADLEEHKNNALLVHEGMTIDERVRSLGEFWTVGEVLVATRTIVETGIDFRGATDLILYDIPRFSRTLAQVLSRFDRIGRAIELNIYVFRATNAADAPEVLEILQRSGEFRRIHDR
jgi:hypothetical protein